MSRFHPYRLGDCTARARRFQPAGVTERAIPGIYPEKPVSAPCPCENDRAQIGARLVPEVDLEGAPLRTSAAVATRIGTSAAHCGKGGFAPRLRQL
jgi:hypothetical protein